MLVWKPKKVEKNATFLKKSLLPRLKRRLNFIKRSIIFYLKLLSKLKGYRASCSLAATILDKLCKAAKEGVTTKELDTYARDLTKEAGAISATIGYGSPPFPAAICTSLNDVICHGIPDDRPVTKKGISSILTIPLFYMATLVIVVVW